MNNKVARIIWIICILIIMGVVGIPKLYQNYHSAPYYNSTNKTIILENEKIHRLNKYQKRQFTKIAKKAINEKDEPFNWQNCRINLRNVCKLSNKHEYKIIVEIRSTLNVKIVNSMIIKLNNRDLINPYDFSVKEYSSGSPGIGKV
ncbi:hypothetical protein [Companilactobacillus bobalius]|uniref:Uncharacterized protein n=1 Tax=Companilactobacillus bobalius TaxID=2801451 RepID=A0A202FEX5_9LACO|nr:hypothetical protein [Companilactobacillus bobalius]KAE9560545.1 hypothetical protein ATN92_10385 [Companilactobacillus bobalius]OVE98992.1 hypothetical protein LKACC16343_00104 [Companilactobacillus bobalius]GEO56968.1 hypothetical protein LBO01_00970 [Companilactobacillus paralimentarius]